MKKLMMLLAAIMILITACLAQAPEKATEKVSGEWMTNLAEAQKLSAENGKPILVDFTGSDWCGWCMRLDKDVFTQDAFIDYAAENLILVKLDFPRDIKQTEEEKERNEMLLRKYQVRGFPTVLLLNADGTVIAETGYQEGGADKYVEHLKGLLEPKQEK